MVSAGQSVSDWPRLLDIACDLMKQVRANAGDHPFVWSLGGGTALMMQIGHRESHDIDIFIDDGQILGFLDPAKADLQFQQSPSGYDGDGARFQKFAFARLGEIDFIVSPHLTNHPFAVRSIEGHDVKLESVAEIIAKKIYYRGAQITPRDIFDIAAAARSHRAQIVSALRGFPDRTEAALTRLAQLNPDFVAGTIAQLNILPDYLDVTPNSLGEAEAVLRAVTA